MSKLRNATGYILVDTNFTLIFFSLRCERLEEQMNDLTELHQNEIENIKSGVTDMEEKVQYQSEERVRDIQEQLATLETRISRMEHQAAQHHIGSIESIENHNARAIVVKGINVLLTLLQVGKGFLRSHNLFPISNERLGSTPVACHCSPNSETIFTNPNTGGDHGTVHHSIDMAVC